MVTATRGDNALPVLSRKDFVTDQEVRWCPGCGDYSILAQTQKVMPDLGVPQRDASDQGPPADHVWRQPGNEGLERTDDRQRDDRQDREDRERLQTGLQRPCHREPQTLLPTRRAGVL